MHDDGRSFRTSKTVSAALRHLRDAEHLLACEHGPSTDQSFHLAGFAPECARKACLAERWTDPALGHNLTETAELILEILTSLDLHAHRYRTEAWADRYPLLMEWNVNCRYDRTGSTDHARAQAMLTEAANATMEICVALWADGFLDGEVIEHDLLR